MNIVTPRLRLREFTPMDVPAIHDIASQRDFVFYNLAPNFNTAAAFVHRAIATAKAHPRRDYKLAVERRSQPGLCIGYVAFDGVDGLEPATPDIGYLIHPIHQGQGYATEAMSHLLALALERYPAIAGVFATAHPQNIASHRVLAKLGLQRDGRMGVATLPTLHGQEPRYRFWGSRGVVEAHLLPQLETPFKGSSPASK
ncbi:MAG: GNAT family N-acetyltransferase [Candidatus Competibacterales bacterium]